MQTVLNRLTYFKLRPCSLKILSCHKNFHVTTSQQAAPKEKSHDSALRLKEGNQNSEPSQLSLGVKVKEASKTVWYSGIVIAGLGATGVILFTIFKELFSSQSPQAIYTKSLKKCCEHPRVCDLLGEPITGFGEESSRGRRKRLRHSFHLKDGIEHIQLIFYIKGIRNSASVYVDMEKINDSFEYSYLIVEIDNYSRERVFIIDNREIQTVN